MKVLVGLVNSTWDPQKKASVGKHAKRNFQTEATRAFGFGL